VTVPVNVWVLLVTVVEVCDWVEKVPLVKVPLVSVTVNVLVLMVAVVELPVADV
jgi:hypothetical protein